MCVTQGKAGPMRDNSVLKRALKLDHPGKLYTDSIALSAVYTKRAFDAIALLAARFEQSTCYRILTKTTQPAHLIAVVCVIVISLLLSPIEYETNSAIWNLLYLGSFSAHFGTQLWMTFVSGLALYFSLPRHVFGSVQEILFPMYFMINSVLSLVTMAVFITSHKAEIAARSDVLIQAIVLIVCFVTEVTIKLYFTPPLLRLMQVKQRLERDAGVGNEVGKVDPKELLKCTKYLHIYKAFRKVHGTIALGNILAISCTCFHLIYMSQRITLTI